MECDRCERFKKYQEKHLIPNGLFFGIIGLLITVITGLIGIIIAQIENTKDPPPPTVIQVTVTNNQDQEEVIDQITSLIGKMNDIPPHPDITVIITNNQNQLEKPYEQSANEQVNHFDIASDKPSLVNRGLQQIIADSYKKYAFDIRERGDGTYIRDLEIIGEHLARSALWRDAVILYHHLFNIKTTGGRRETILENLRFTNTMWINEGDFIRSIANDSVKAITNGNVRLRNKPVLDDGENIIKVLPTNLEAQVLARSDLKEAIDGLETYYWYKILIDGIEDGWVYGKYIYLYPDPAAETGTIVQEHTATGLSMAFNDDLEENRARAGNWDIADAPREKFVPVIPALP